MKIYHTETQADYDALMIELEEQMCFWGNGFKMKAMTATSNRWGWHTNNTCVSVDGRSASLDHKDYYEMEFPHAPIIKYKAKTEE